MGGNHNDIEKKLWSAADQLRANSRLKSSEYSVPFLDSYSCDTQTTSLQKPRKKSRNNHRRRKAGEAFPK
jgi:type I restriction enzyme M protein